MTSLTAINAMTESASLLGRVAACYALQATTTTVTNADGTAVVMPPRAWAQSQAWTLATQSGWADAWDTAPLYNPDGTKTDIGGRGDVITDLMITTAVTNILAAQAQAAAGTGA